MWTWVFLTPLVLLGCYVVYNRFLHPLARVPGPFLASITPLWLAWQGFCQRRPRLDLDLHKQYGSVVRISPDEIMFSNPEFFRPVYGAGTKFTKGRFYEAPTEVAPGPDWEKLDMLAERDIEKLRIQKRLAGPVYSTNNVKRHEAYIDMNIERWFNRLKKSTGQPLDIYHELELVTVDVMTQMTFGFPYGAVEAGSDGGHMATMDNMWSWWGWTGYLPLVNKLDKRFGLAFVTDAVKLNLPVFPYCVGRIMAHDKDTAEGKPTTPCILDDLRRLSREKPEFRLNWGTKLSITDLGAGVDTSSWSLAALLAAIGSDKRVYERLKAELDTAVSAGTIDKHAPVSYDASAGLEYLQACMHEALRLWPNIAISIPRIAPAGGITIDAYHIPQGYTVGMNSRQLGLSEEIFGPDPQVFHPERWLQADKTRRNDMETRNLSFGGPSRKCPGMHLAWVYMSKLLASFLLTFELKVLNELDGKLGAGGHRWVEKGSFVTKWHGLEIEIQSI